jgi:hypothetical protein
MLIELSYRLCVLPIRCYRRNAIVLENGFPVLGGEVEEILKRSPLVFLVGKDAVAKSRKDFGTFP